ncbi:MAG: hypothetical protein IPM64_06255 [Phycisphaerales bacterium]|nr:hypothetical protein [Phycisphaerales bacterium]
MPETPLDAALKPFCALSLGEQRAANRALAGVVCVPRRLRLSRAMGVFCAGEAMTAAVQAFRSDPDPPFRPDGGERSKAAFADFLRLSEELDEAELTGIAVVMRVAQLVATVTQTRANVPQNSNGLGRPPAAAGKRALRGAPLRSAKRSA